MPMERADLLNAIIDDGIEEVRHAYPRPSQAMKRDGAMDGFESCRGKGDDALLQILAEAREAANRARMERSPRYWWHRMREVQVEWVLNVLSAAMQANGMRPLLAPTAHGMLKAADILGVREA